LALRDDNSETLKTLAMLFKAEELPGVVRACLQSGLDEEGFNGEGQEGLSALVPRIPEELLPEVWVAARQVPYPEDKACFYRALAPRLAGPALAELAGDLPGILDENARIEVFFEVLPRLSRVQVRTISESFKYENTLVNVFKLLADDPTCLPLKAG